MASQIQNIWTLFQKTKNSTSLSTFCMEFFYCVEQKDKNMFARSLVFLRGQLGTYIVVHTGPPERMGTWGTVPPPFLGRMVNLISIRGTDYAHLFQPSFLEKWFCKLRFFSGWRKVVLQTQIFFWFEKSGWPEKKVGLYYKSTIF